MQMLNVIYATGALRKFLEARAQGAPRELLMKLSADSLAELEADRAKVPANRQLSKMHSCVVIDFNDHCTASARVNSATKE